MPLNRKTAFINLTTHEVDIQDVPLDLRKHFFGGRGLNMYYLTHLAPRGIDPFDADSPLIFGAGLLTGVLGGRMNVSGKSPESGYLGDSNVGGYFGAELAGTGFSHLVITGKSPTPVYLYIENENIAFVNAAHLWGKQTGETQAMIREELRDDRVQTMCIGPAGENRVRFACLITGPKNAAGRTGLGALMGSKRLKAVTVRGNTPFSIHDPRGYIDLLRETNTKSTSSAWGKALGTYGTPILFKNANSRGWTSYRYHQKTTVGDQAWIYMPKTSKPRWARARTPASAAPSIAAIVLKSRRDGSRAPRGKAPNMPVLHPWDRPWATWIYPRWSICPSCATSMVSIPSPAATTWDSPSPCMKKASSPRTMWDMPSPGATITPSNGCSPTRFIETVMAMSWPRAASP